MKSFKKIASAIAALSLAACMVAPVATMTSFAHDVTINQSSTDTSNATHQYKAYQVFSGNASKESEKTILSNIVWGEGVNGDSILAALKDLEYAKKDIYPDDEEKSESETKVKPFGECTNAKDVADVLAKFTDNSIVAKDFAEKVGANLSSKTTGTYSATDSMKITGLSDGYYLIMDDGEPTEEGTAKPNSSAMTRFMLKVVGGDVEVTTKVAAPSVDKQVKDEAIDKEEGSTDANGWGETADHAIGETFQFRLTANMPKNAEIDSYKKYTLKFNDKMAKGVTFETIKSVTINFKTGASSTDPVTVPAYESGNEEKNNGYVTNFDDLATSKEGELFKGDDTHTWSLAIPDLVALIGTNKLSDIESVVVEYDAHLNDEAIVVKSNVSETDGTYGAAYESRKVNINDVYLNYSNNPNKGNWDFSADGDTETGQTTPDTVGVFTYEVDSTKYKDEAKDANVLNGAEFELYTDEGCTEKVNLFYDSTMQAYRPVKSGESAETMVSGKDSSDSTNKGIFNIKGLDVGTYYLKETKAPAGYNTADVVKIEIKATHDENDVGTGANLTLTKSDGGSTYNGASGLSGNIIDKKGATLPSTGGIGTTLFYLGGGALVAVAGVMLITKKRMTKE